MARRAIVVGAGWGGCAAALRLLERGWRVDLLDRRGEMGGRARALRLASRGVSFDNGQHLFLGAYRCALRVLRTLGTEDGVRFQPRLEVPFLLPHGQARGLTAGRLFGPLDLAAGVASLDTLDFAEKRAALALGLWAGPELALLAAGRAPRSMRGRTARQWLLRRGQPAAVVAKLWEPLVLAACNATLDQADASVLGQALARGFLKGGAAARLGFAQAPLSDLLAPLAGRLKQGGGMWRGGVSVAAAGIQPQGPAWVRLAGGETLEADALVMAVPAAECARLLSGGLAQELGVAAMAKAPASPIVSVYLRTHGPLLATPFGAFLNPEGGQPAFHWAFDKGAHSGGGHWHCFVCSAAGAFQGASRANVLEELYGVLMRFLPAFKPAEVAEAIVVGEAAATPALTPSFARLRPPQRTPWKNLALAGDWTDTGLPATIEGAVKSGLLAAEAVL